MSTLYQVRFNLAEEMPPDPGYIDARVFTFHFSYGPLDRVEKAEENVLLMRVVVPGLPAIELGQDIEKILYWLAAKKKNLRAYIERQATGLQLVELKTIPSYPDPSTIEYPPKDPLIVEIDRKIGFKP